MNSIILDEKIKKLTPDEQEKVIRFIDTFITAKSESGTPHIPSFNWSGGLSELKSEFTSIELQKKASEWRIENI